jgi:hypothetical protein
MMSVETAEALILMAKHSTAHCKYCLRTRVRSLPRELLIEALSVLEPEDVEDARRWFADYGVELPTLPESPEDKAVIRISKRILDYLGRSEEPQTREEIEANVKGKTVHKRTALKNLCISGRVVESGAGSKGDPLRYTMSRMTLVDTVADAGRLVG